MGESDKKHVILIVDDAPVEVSFLSRMLLPLYDVKAVTSGEACLEFVLKHEVDLILMDVVMKGISGYEAIEALKNNSKTKSIPVIFITGMDRNDDEIKGLSLGAVDYIRKPFVEEIVKLRVKTQLTILDQMRVIERFGLVDVLTDLDNRRSFQKRIEEEWRRAARDSTPLAMLMVDVDRFKNFNDKYGHDVGDVCLQVVSKVLRRTVKRGADCVFRWGGEEFCVLMPGSDIHGAMVVAEEIRSNVENASVNLGYGEKTSVTVSIGAGSAIPSRTVTLEVFCKAIDLALYDAKYNGRNMVSCVPMSYCKE